ncbi:coiled-coil domain-containing protein 158 [Lepisosteus oculatus]|uniref:coiled-coil domain-containing protein 158 n=1 Tax=Lepisosteus oculatus TaxID=7918 RepID=UPI003710CE6C
MSSESREIGRNDTSLIAKSYSMATGSGVTVGVSVQGGSVIESSYPSAEKGESILEEKAAKSLQPVHKIAVGSYAESEGIRFASLGNRSLEELREHLERQTRETQRLQEEVEQATKLTMEKISRSFGDPAPRPTSGLSVSLDTISEVNGQDVLTSSGQSAGLSLRYGLELEALRRSCGFPGKDLLEKALEEYGQQVKELQRRLSETCELHEQQKFHFRQSIIKLQTKLQESQIEKDALADIRQKESRGQAELINKLQASVRELEAARLAQEQEMRDAASRAEPLSRKRAAQEQALQEVRSELLAHEQRSGKKAHENEVTATLNDQNLGTALGKVLRALEAENAALRGRVLPVAEQLEAEKREGQLKADLILKQHQERMEQLILSHEQEVAALSEKLGSARCQATSIQRQMDIVQEQAANQSTMYLRQVTDLESTVSHLRSELREAKRMYEDKVESLEKKLILACSEAEAAQCERDQYSQESGDLDSQLCQLMANLHKAQEELNLEREQNKRLWDRDTGNSIAIDSLRRELDERSMEVQRLEALVKSLKEECRVQVERQLKAEQGKNEKTEEAANLCKELEVTKDLLRQAGEELKSDRAVLEERTRALGETELDRKKLQLLLAEREGELQRSRARLEGTGASLRASQAEAEALRLKLGERETMADMLRQQMESVTQIAGQHSRNTEKLHSERVQLLNELNGHKLDIQQLKAVCAKRDHRLSELEQEQVQLLSVLSEKACCMKELTLEKQQLTADLEVQRIQLVSLTEEHESLKKTFSSKSEEMENMAAKLKAQLLATRSDLQQTTNTLRALEGADGHGMKVAMGMQRQITAKRGQIDALQSRIHFLEETLENLAQEKRYQASESRRLSQDLAAVTSEKNRLVTEVETLRFLERELKDKVTKLEAALDTLSERFSECQDLVQRQEQEVTRLKLQYALDVKELQGPNFRAAGGQQRPPSHSCPFPAPQQSSGHLPAPKSTVLQENPTQELKALVKELRSVIEDDISPSALGRRRKCEPEQPRTPALSEVTKDNSANSTLNRDSISSREPLTLHTADLHEGNLPSSLASQGFELSLLSATPRYTSSPRGRPSDRRSPVHSLLTTPAPVPRPQTEKSQEPPFPADRMAASEQMKKTGQTCRKLQGRLDSLQSLVEDLQMKNQEMSTMIKSQEKRMKKVKDRDELFS